MQAESVAVRTKMATYYRCERVGLILAMPVYVGPAPQSADPKWSVAIRVRELTDRREGR